jgi:hypothetical protein
MPHNNELPAWTEIPQLNSWRLAVILQHISIVLKLVHEVKFDCVGFKLNSEPVLGARVEAAHAFPASSNPSGRR